MNYFVSFTTIYRTGRRERRTWLSEGRNANEAWNSLKDQVLKDYDVSEVILDKTIERKEN